MSSRGRVLWRVLFLWQVCFTKNWVKPPHSSGDGLQAQPRESGTFLRSSFGTVKLTLSWTSDPPSEWALASLISGGCSHVLAMLSSSSSQPKAALWDAARARLCCNLALSRNRRQLAWALNANARARHRRRGTLEPKPFLRFCAKMND